MFSGSACFAVWAGKYSLPLLGNPFLGGWELGGFHEKVSPVKERFFTPFLMSLKVIKPR